MAAVKACGPGAVLCGRAAGWLWGVVRGPAPPPEVLTLTERRVSGVVTRRRRRSDPKKAQHRVEGDPGHDGPGHPDFPVFTAVVR